MNNTINIIILIRSAQSEENSQTTRAFPEKIYQINYTLYNQRIINLILFLKLLYATYKIQANNQFNVYFSCFVKKMTFQNVLIYSFNVNEPDLFRK